MSFTIQFEDAELPQMACGHKADAFVYGFGGNRPICTRCDCWDLAPGQGNRSE